jgi:hypothetical protein
VSKINVVTPQTVRGIVAAFAGQSTSNGTIFADIFPPGYNPWLYGINFQDYATGPNGAAINLGLADDANNSQRICFTSVRAGNGDTVVCLQMHFGQLWWTSNGDSMVIGTPNSTADLELGYSSRIGYDAVNKNALVHFGGSVTSTGGGVGISTGTAFANTYLSLWDQNGNFGVGGQKTNATLDPFWVAPAGDATAHSYTTTGLPSGCAQYPCVVYKNSLTAQSAAYNGANIYTPTAAGTYRLSCTEYITTAGTAGTMQCGFNWKSNGLANPGTSLSSPTTSMTTAGNGTVLTAPAHLDGVTGVGVFTNYTGATGTPVYGLDVVIERLQ